MVAPVAIGMGLIGSAVSAAGSLAGGSYAAQAGAMQQQAANYTAAQLEENAPGAIGAAQRKMLDDRNKAQQAESTLRARGGASGVDIGSGSPVQVGQSVAGRGEYQALMDKLFPRQLAANHDDESDNIPF